MSSAHVGVVQMWEASRELGSERSADDLQEVKTLFEPLLRAY